MTDNGLPTIASSISSRPNSPRGLSPKIDGQPVPPDGASPALVAKLTRLKSAVPATLSDLARRGVIRIEATPRSQPQSNQYTLHRQTATQAQLSPYEPGVLDTVFQMDDSVSVSSVARRMA